MTPDNHATAPTGIRYRHLKTGNVYRLVGLAKDATNGREGQVVALYQPEGAPHVTYVREVVEFGEKFKVVDDVAADQTARHQ